jgi:hypothetical protein
VCVIENSNCVESSNYGIFIDRSITQWDVFFIKQPCVIKSAGLHPSTFQSVSSVTEVVRSERAVYLARPVAYFKVMLFNDDIFVTPQVLVT